MSEVDQIQAHYAERAADPRLQSLYGPTSAGDVFMVWRRDVAVRAALQRAGLFPLFDKRILDIGCGDGPQLRRFVDMGADPACCYGIDLNGERLAKARYQNAHMTLLEGSAEQIPLEDGSFDIISQMTAFSSMPSDHMRRRCAEEMLRLVKHSGVILWYDFRVRHPQNRHVVPLSASAVRDLFPGCSIDLHSHTLAPPLARKLAPRSEVLCLVLEKVPVLRTHYLGVLVRTG